MGLTKSGEPSKEGVSDTDLKQQGHSLVGLEETNCHILERAVCQGRVSGPWFCNRKKQFHQQPVSLEKRPKPQLLQPPLILESHSSPSLLRPKAVDQLP